MDKTKAERIGVFLRGWGYKPDEVNAYIRKVAPNLEFNAKKARHDRMNAFLNDVMGREQKPSPGTPIPAAASHETGFSRDLWIMLGTGPDALTLEDLVDYYAEYISGMMARREAEAPSSMSLSQAIYAMGEEDRPQSCADLIERHKQMTERKDDFSMDNFLRNMNTEVDSTPRTIIPLNPTNIRADGRVNDDLNGFFRNLL